MRVVSLVALTLLLFACSNEPSSRYSQKHDSAPKNVPNLEHIEDAQPKHEPYSKQGNRNYTLRGQSYQIITDTQGFKERGMASWYGKKFHGHLTSNGETYDMYSMTAAHKTLPIPSYVEVTNLDNQRKAIVRVNDRGPFHPGRIIDLSYAAAYKLDVISHGVANVEIRVISSVPNSATQFSGNKASEQFFVQVVALSNRQRINQLADELTEQYKTGHRVIQQQGLSKLQLGPLSNAALANALISKLHQNGYPKSFLISQSKN
ncbi:septal ring lytic transglycosylase RlpA family protein [Paraferrimonas haliotis]|uniref:Endolytic peptidoglycan transglycosylase RlpA n=1 Tax=Paraferrimonas haliotis TaxID=2013866 RepID=A0AA37TNA6_9GAMM|nr:septal ring lytic transglycosylase RlpA family protein [Paraferrimonas haliotis]GLS83563.1 septal ring lipoprotein RlpA [Paraferrimonas haliotis]